MNRTSPGTNTETDLPGRAVEILTAIARQTRTRGAGTHAETTEPVDFAAIAAQVLTAVAANVGGIEELLAGRSESWEADLVRQLVDGTAASGRLVLWRTDPVRLHVDAETVFFDFFIGALFEQEQNQAVERTYDDTLTDTQLDAAEHLAAAITALWEQDKAAYIEAYRVTAQRYLTELGATCGVESVTAAPDVWDGLSEQIHEYARQHTPLPMTGAAPDWSGGTPADALRRAGHTYTTRAAAPGPPAEQDKK